MVYGFVFSLIAVSVWFMSDHFVQPLSSLPLSEARVLVSQVFYIIGLGGIVSG